MDKKERMAELKSKGLSYQSIANIFGISRQRVHQILSEYQVLNHSGRHRNGWYAEIKALVLERDDYKCQRCDSPNNLLVHHQDANDNNNELSNLITLCNKCHLELHRPKTHKGNRKRDRDKALREYKDQHPELSLKEVGVVFGITKGRVSQIINREKERENDGNKAVQG